MLKRNLEHTRRAFEGMNPLHSQNNLIFDSKFESGNLDIAFKVLSQ